MKKELLNKTEKELHTLVAEKRSALRNFRFAVSGSKNRNVKEGRAFRKDIARALTAVNSHKALGNSNAGK